MGVGHSRRLLVPLVARVELITSDFILSELDETLRADPRLARLVPARIRTRYVALLARASRLVVPGESPQETPDPDDGPVFATALAARVPLVTGDKVLLRASVPGVRVLSVRQALEEMGLM